MNDALQEVMAHVLENGLGQVWTALPGIVRSYSTATQLASVQPAVQAPTEDADGERTDATLPVIPDVPVCWPRGNSQYLHLGLAAGDEVLLVFATLDPSGWHRTGGTAKAADIRRHHPSHAFAIPGLGSRGRALPDTGLIVSKATINTTLTVTQSASVGGNTDAAALASVVDAFLVALAASTPPPATEPGLLAIKTAMAAYVTSASQALKVGS